jgi:WD repeat and SOF domain-containing protein 1
MTTVYSSSFSSSAFHKKEKSPFLSLPFSRNEKHLLTQPGGRRWTTPVHIPAPAFVRRPITIHVPLPPSVYRSLLVRKVGQLVALALGLIALLALIRRRHSHHEGNSEAPTLVFGRNDLRRIWQWEIAAGHYPSTRRSRPSNPSFQPLLTRPSSPSRNTVQYRV